MSLGATQLPNDNISCFWNEAVLPFIAVSWLLHSGINLVVKWVSIYLGVVAFASSVDKYLCSYVHESTWLFPSIGEAYICRVISRNFYLFIMSIFKSQYTLNMPPIANAGKLVTFERVCLSCSKQQSTRFDCYTLLEKSHLFEDESQEDRKERWQYFLPEWFWQCRPSRGRLRT
jgi:hypothetical protein